MTTAENLRIKSENLKKGIRQLITELRGTTATAAAQMQSYEDEVEKLKAQHEQDIALLRANYAALDALIEENEQFASRVEEILGE